MNCVISTVITLMWLAVFGACCSIWGIQVGLCALAVMILAQLAIRKLIPHAAQRP